MTLASRLHAAIGSVAPIDSVSIVRPSDKTTWRIYFKSEATEEQKQAARLALLSFDVSEPQTEPTIDLAALVQSMAAEIGTLKAQLKQERDRVDIILSGIGSANAVAP